MKESPLLFLSGIGFQELIVLVFILLPAILWIWAIIDLLKSNFENDTNKIIWALIIIFIPFIGAILYLALGRTQKKSAP
jgi:hypothetical protein